MTGNISLEIPHWIPKNYQEIITSQIYFSTKCLSRIIVHVRVGINTWENKFKTKKQFEPKFTNNRFALVRIIHQWPIIFILASVDVWVCICCQWLFVYPCTTIHPHNSTWLRPVDRDKGKTKKKKKKSGGEKNKSDKQNKLNWFIATIV